MLRSVADRAYRRDVEISLTLQSGRPPTACGPRDDDVAELLEAPVHLRVIAFMSIWYYKAIIFSIKEFVPCLTLIMKIPQLHPVYDRSAAPRPSAAAT